MASFSYCGNFPILADPVSTPSTPIYTAPARGLNLDPFGRQRVSEVENIFEFIFRYEESFDTYFSTKDLLGGTQSFLTSNTSYQLACTSTVGSEAIVQSRRYIEYTSGEGHLVLMTFNMKGAVANTTKRFGTYENGNGIFFEMDGIVPTLVIRSDTSGSVVDTKIPQSLWNGDKFDGTGEADAFDWNLQHLMFFDFAWLGSGNVRFGFYDKGTFITAHTVVSSNNITVPFMRTATLPVRAEIIGNGVASDMYITCIAVEREGRKSEIGRVRNVNTGITPITFSGTETAIIAIRIRSGFTYSSIKSKVFELLSDSGTKDAIYRVYLNPILTGETWVPVTNSITESSINIASFTPGTLVDSGHLSLTQKSVSGLNDLDTDTYLGRDIDGNSDIILLTMQTISGNGSVHISAKWREFL